MLRCCPPTAVRRLTDENRLPHLLLYGPPGTGKTSTILAVARQIYGSSMQNMTLELNASDDRGIDVVRQQVQDFASTRSVFRWVNKAQNGYAPYISPAAAAAAAANTSALTWTASDWNQITMV